MDPSSGITQSVWMATAQTPVSPSLKKKEKTDVCIVGAGIAGMSCAYHLCKTGKSVIVLDDGRIGGGETERTTAHISNAFDDRYYVLEGIHGKKAAKLTAQSHTAAIDFIEQTVKSEKIDCNFLRLPGYLFVPPGESTDVIDKELRAANQAGLSGVKRLDKVPDISFHTGPCLLFPDQAQFHPLKYLSGLAEAIKRMGGVIHNGSRVVRIQGGDSAVVDTADGKSVACKHIIIATNAPTHDNVQIYSKQAAYRTYVIGLEIPRNNVKQALYWDTLDPYHYVRLAGVAEGKYDVLIVGGEDHKTGQPSDEDKPYGALERWAKKHFPQTGEVLYRWSGQIMETIDSLAMIGRLPSDEPNVYIVIGDSGQGITNGTIAGMLLTDLITGKKNPWAELFDPARVPVKAAKEFFKENLNVAKKFTDWVQPADVTSEKAVKPGHGAVIRDGIKRIALYRDEKGSIHRLSAVCPHKGCIVNWNDGEKSWDCPCHGSRYKADGTLVNGPSGMDLKPVK